MHKLLPLLLVLGCAHPEERVARLHFPTMSPFEDDGLPPVASRVGMAQQLAWGPSAARRGQLDRLQSIGVRLDRMDFSWHRVEPRAGEWSFDALDPVVEDATRAGIELIGLLCYGNPAYPQRPDKKGSKGTNLPLDPSAKVFFPPVENEDFARYVSKVVERYGSRVKRWEIWNEQNLGYRFWRPEVDAKAYVELARASALAGRAVCSDCTFAIGGLSMPQPVPRLDLYPVGPKFLAQMYAADPSLASWADAIGYHPYQMPKDAPEIETNAFPDYDRFQGSLATQTHALEKVVAAHGKHVPLWITENGWPTNPGIPRTNDEIARVFGLDEITIQFGRGLLGEEEFAKVLETLRGVDEQTQARYLVRSVLISLSLHVPINVLYVLDDYPVEPEINQEGAFGVFRVDGSEKPAAPALRTLLTRFGSYRFVAEVAADPAERAVLLRDGKRMLLAMWRFRDGKRRVVVDALPSHATAYSMSGEVLSKSGGDSELSIELGPDVTYVEVQGPEVQGEEVQGEE